MRTALLVAAFAVPLALCAALLRPEEEAPAGEASEAPLGAEGAAVEASGEKGAPGLRGTPAAPRVVEAVAQPRADPAEPDWALALVESAAGHAKEAFALAKRARRISPAFFEDKKRLARWKEMEAAAAAFESSLAALRLAALERAARDPSEDRRLTPEERAALDETFRRTAEIIATAQSAEERAALLRHARRFLLPPSISRGDGLASRLAGLARQRGGKADDPLPADDEEAVEARRVDQLEKLRQRDLVSLLDRIHAGLAWLALHQAEDGRFSDAASRSRCDKLSHAHCTPGTDDASAIATTGLALCAFLDFRDQDALGLFEPTLSRGIAWLLSKQGKDGNFPGGRETYSSAIALMAMAQAAGSTQRPDLRQATERGLAWFGSAQHEAGGFRYAPRQAGDLSATGWVAQAFAAAKAAGVGAPPAVEEGIDRFLDSVWIGDRRFGYTDRGRESASLAPVGMLTGLLVWKDTSSATLVDWRHHLSEPVRRRNNLYWLYYAVRVGLALEGGMSPALRDATLRLAAGQSNKGDAAGSFPGNLDPWLSRGGTTLQTAVAVLTLEHALFLR